MSDLLLNGVPSNVRLPRRLRGARMMTSDVYNVCDRIKEIDPNLYVVIHENTEQPFVVMEHCTDGEERMVKRYKELTPEILTDLRRMLAIPWETRFKKLAKEVDDHNRKAENAWEESESHERFVFDMGQALKESNLAPGRVSPVHMYRGKK